MSVLANSPGLLRTNGRKSATLAFVRAQVFFVMIIGFLTRMAIVAAGEESRHLGDNVIMIVVHVEVNFLVFLRTTVNDIIAVLFLHDIDLIIAQVRLEQFCLFKPARTKRHARILVEFLCQTRLHRSTVIRHTLVLWIVIELGFGDYESSCHTYFIILNTNQHDFFFSRCLSKFTSERLLPLPPIGMLT